MRLAMKIFGWVLLVVGILATASNIAQMITGFPGRIGPLLISIVLVVIGLCLVSSGKKSTDTKGDGQAGTIPEQGGCPLCAKTQHMKKPQTVYGVPICKRCSSSLYNRRFMAHAIDEMLWVGLFLVITNGGASNLADPISLWFILIYLMKDGIWGYSPGKALFGLQVINENNGNPIGVLRSIKRNLPFFVPIMPLIILYQVQKGHRTGDFWAQSKVIWKRYSSHPIFQHKASKDYIWTQEVIALEANNALSMAMKAERDQLWNKAAGLYHKIVMQFPSAPVAEDAKVALELLKKRMSEQGISITCENEVEKPVPCFVEAISADKPFPQKRYKKVIILVLCSLVFLLNTIRVFVNLPHYAQEYGYLNATCIFFYIQFLGGICLVVGAIGYFVKRRTFSLRALGVGSCIYLILALISIAKYGLKDDSYPVFLVFASLTVAMMVSIIIEKYKIKMNILSKHT